LDGGKSSRDRLRDSLLFRREGGIDGFESFGERRQTPSEPELICERPAGRVLSGGLGIVQVLEHVAGKVQRQ